MRRWLALILFAGLAIRLGWGLSRPADAAAVDLLPDQRGYLEIARNADFWCGGGAHYVDPRFGQTVYAARTLGYPAFVAACGTSVVAVRVVQAFVDTLTALAIFLLARRLGGSDRAALLAAALVAFNPFLVFFSALLLTETLYTSMLAWGMLLLTSRAHLSSWFVGTVILAFAFFVRPAGVGLPVVLAAVAAVGRRSVIAAAVVALVVTVATPVPWAKRNQQVLGRWIWSTTNDGITLYDGLHPGATGASDQSFVERMPELRAMTEIERSDYLKRQALTWARENPGRAAWLAAVKVARTWSPVPLSNEFGRPLYRVIAIIFAVPFYTLLIVGIGRNGLKRPATWFLLAPALYFTVIHAMSVGSLRYRIPAEPPLAVLAGTGAAWLIDRRAKEERAAPS